MSEPNVFDRIVERMGSQRKLAQALNIKPQSLTNWRGRIPAERALEIERLVGGEITCHEMRPDVFGPSPDAAA